VLEIGVIEKSGDFVGSVIHLPSNTLIKKSARSADEAISQCLGDINSEISKLEWFYIQTQKGNISFLSINEHFNFSCENLSVVTFEECLDKANILICSHHQFSFNNKKYSGYVFKAEHFQLLLEVIVNNEEFELKYC